MDHRISVLGYSKQSKSRWLKFLECELDHVSLRSSSEKLGVEISTTFNMRHKYLPLLSKILFTNKNFNNIVQADETYFDFNTKGNKNACMNFIGKKYSTYYASEYVNLGQGKKLHLRDKSSTMDNSYSKVCVPTVIFEDKTLAFSKPSNWGTPTADNLDSAFENKLKNVTYMITDGERAMRKFAKKK